MSGLSTDQNPFALSSIQAASAPPQEPDDDNPFALRNIQQEQAGQLRVVTNDAVKVNPDAAAEVARLRKRYPTPDDVMLRNLQDVKLQAAVDDADEIYKTSPKLATAMRDAGLIRQAHDDLPQLARIESGFTAMTGAGAAQATLGVSESIWRTPDAASRLVGYLASLPEKGGLPRAINPIRGVQDLIDIVGKGKLPYFGKLFSGTTDVAEKVNDASKALQDRGTFGDAFADLSTASQNADLALAHALRGNGKPLADVVTDPRYVGAFVAQAAPSLVMAWKSGGSLPFIGWLEGMEQASSAADFEKRTGQKVSDAAFAQAFVETATVNALLERYGLDKLVKAKGKSLSSILKAMVAEGGTEGLQQVNTNLAEQLSFNPEKKLTEGVVASVVGGAGSGGGGRAVGVAAERISQSVQERTARDAIATAEGKRMEGQLQTAADSKLRERNPEAFREVVAQLSEQEGTDSTVYVDAEVLNQLAPEVLNQLPAEVLAQLPQALQTGDVVAIPAADALTFAPGTPLEQMLVEHGRIGDPEAASQFEVKEQGAAAGQQLQEAAQRVIQEAMDKDAMQAGHDAVREGILTQLNTLGRFRPAVNEGYATWAAAFYTTMAGRTGMTPEAFAAKYPLRITGGLQAVALEQAKVARTLAEASAKWQASLAGGSATDMNYVAQVSTPEALRQMGVLGSSLALPARVAKQVATKHPDVPLSVLRDLPALLHDPLFIVPHRDGGVSVVLDARTAAGSLIVVGVREGRVRTITPADAPAGHTSDARVAGWLQEALAVPGKVYARNKEALAKAKASVAAPDRANSVEALPRNRASVITRDALVKRLGSEFYQKGDTPRGTFNPETLELALSPNADLSTFFHETGHFFLEVMADIASQPEAPATITEDMGTLLKWFGATIEQWSGWQKDYADSGYTKIPEGMTRAHERFAEGIEQYLLEGKAPSAELQPVFGRFRAWMMAVYKSLTSFVTGRPQVQLSDDVRAVMDRLVASDVQIAQTQESMQYGLDEAATEEALSTLAARSVRDLKWAKNAFSRALKAMQAEAKGLRREVRIEARREILSMPVYQAFMFLTVKRSSEDIAKTAAERAKGNTKSLDPSNDSLLTAIAKLGGLARESAGQLLGVHADNFNHQSGVFGKPVFRAKGGLSADAMGEALAEAGYLLPSENARYDLRELEDLIDAELRGSPQYSIAKQYGEAARTGEGTDLAELRAGRFDFGDLHTLGLPEGSIAKLEALGMTLKEGGIHPDIVADGFGFENGQDLVAALLAAESPLTAVEGKTDQLMLQRHGDLVDQRALEAAALQAVHNQARAKSLATELKAQADALGARTDTGEVNAKGSKITVSSLMQAAQRFAADVVARTTVQDLERTARKHTAAEKRAGQRWQEATAKGDTAAAIKAKQDQFLNNAAAKALMDAMGEARKIVSYFRDVVKDGDKKTVEKGRDPDVVNAARAILAAYGIGTKGEKSANDYLGMVKQYDPQMFAVINESVQSALQMAQPLKALTVEQLRSLNEEIQGLWHLAKRSRQMEVAGNLMDIDDAAGEVVDRTEALGVPLVSPGETGALTPADLRKRWLQTAGSILRRVEQWAEGMDGKTGGPFKRYIFGPIKAAADAYRTDKVKYLKAYQALIDAVAPSLRKGLIAAPELGYTFGKGHNGIGHAELLHAILHTGNESNKRKLLLGRKWATQNEDGSLNTGPLPDGRGGWDAFVARMQAEGTLGKVHYDFAQGVWDLLEQTKPLAQKAHRDVFGRYFAEVTADAFETPFGSYRGGYVPAQADPRIVQDADMRALAEAENANMMFSFPTTSKGFTKGRVEYNRPLMLDLRTIGQHIDKVLLFAHMEPAVRDVHRLLERKGVSSNLGKIDPTIYSGMLTPWLKRSALQIVETPVAGDGGISRVASVLRGRAGMALMFANVSNAIQQTTGFISAFGKLKADGLESHMMRGAAQMLTSPKKMTANVAELSPFMRNRMENEISAINGAMNEILLDPSLYKKAQAWSSKHAYFLQSALDNTMGPIIWTAGYNAMLTKGASEAEAIAYADGLIRQTQGSTLPEDVSRLETGPAYARIFTQFIGYFNMMANTNATALKQIATETGWKRGGAKALGVVFLGMLAPLWVAEAIAVAMKGGPDDEDKDGYLDDWIAAVLGMGTIKGTLAMVPFVGQLVVAAINRFNKNPADDRVSMSPAVSMLEASGGVAVHVYKAAKGEDINGRTAIRDVASLVSLLTGIPVTAAARPLGYLAGEEQGKISPTGPVDAARGLVTGTPSPESKQR